MQHTCPWESWSSSPLEFCEAVHCAWLRQPINTWSNIPFLIFALLMLWQLQGLKSPLLRLFALISIVIGLGSGFYHASATTLGAHLDYAGMFLASAIITAINIRRWLEWSNPKSISLCLILAATLLSLSIVFPEYSRLIYVVAMPGCLVELLLFLRDRNQIRYKFYLYSFSCSLLAALFWVADLTEKFCDPQAWISGHALWHSFMALSFYLLFLFYRQFALLK